MPAPAKYPTPHAQMRVLATYARSEGVTFEEFWDRAMRPGLPPATVAWLEEDHAKYPPPEGAILWPRDTTDRNQYIAAAEFAKETWRAVWEGDPLPPSIAALRILAPMIAEDYMDVADADHAWVAEVPRALGSGEPVPSAA